MFRKLHQGRYTAQPDGDFVVFLIGMRFNRIWAVHQWLPVFLAMSKMLMQLQRHPDKGLLHYRTVLDGKGVTVIQYWRSVDHLMRFAWAKEDPHVPAMRAFYRRARASSGVGIWHETLPVRVGEFEALYGNMPAFGAARAFGGPVPARAHTRDQAPTAA